MLSRFGLGLGGVTRVAGRGLPADLAVFADGTDGFLFDFSKPSKLWKDTTATTPVVAAGDGIARSDDISPRGRNATQATTAAQPKWQTGGLARFDGLDDNLLTTFVPGPAMTLMAKFQGVAPDGGNIRIAIGGRDAANTRCYLAINGLGVGGTPAGLLAGVGASTITAGSFNNVLGVGAVTYDGTTVRLYWNGVEIASAAQVGLATTVKPLAVGAFNDVAALSQFWSGDIHRALAIKKALSAADIVAITNLWGTT